MPTISPQIRAQIGGMPHEQAPLARKTMKVATGMDMPKISQTEPEAAQGLQKPMTGQPVIQEETPAAAVTLSPQLTALARKEQKIREREAALTAKEADYIPKSAFKEQLQKNVAEALKTLGTNYEELTQLQLAQLQGDDPVQSLRSEVEQLKRSQEEQTNKQYDATLKQYRAETNSLISSDPKAFHFINKGKHQDSVVQHIVETWQENPDEVLTVAQAAKEVEDVLREDAKATADLLKELDPPVSPEKHPMTKTLPPPQRTAPKTLTQSVEATPTRTYGQFQHLSMKERIAQSVARAQK